MFFRGTRVGSVVHVERISESFNGLGKFFAEKIASRGDGLLRPVRRGNVAEENGIPNIIVAREDKPMIWPVFGIQKDPKKHLGDVRRDRKLKSSQSQKNLEKVLQSVWRFFDLGVQTLSVIDRFAVPDDSDWCCFLLHIANAEERQVATVKLENFVSCQFPDIVLREIIVENRSDLLESLGWKFVDKTVLTSFDRGSIVAKVWLVSILPWNRHLELLDVWKIRDLHAIVNCFLFGSPLSGSWLARGSWKPFS